MEKDNSNIPNKDDEQLNESEEQIFINVNPNNSQDSIMNNGSAGFGYQSPYCGYNNRGLSPSGSGRSVREYEELIESLRKENFNLKLKIYVLEVNLPNLTSSEDHDSLVKKNLEIMVNVEILKNEIEEKKQLLREAADAIKQIEDYQKSTERKHLQIIDDLKLKIQHLQWENSTLIKDQDRCDSIMKDNFSKIQLINSNNERNQIINSKIEEMNSSIDNFEMKIKELTSQIELQEDAISKKDITIKDLEQKLKEMNNQITNQEQLLYTKNRNVDSLKKTVDGLKSEKSELEDIISSQKQSLNTSDTVKIQKDLDKCRSAMADKMCELNELQEKYNNQKTEFDKAVKYIEKLIEVTKAMQKEIQELQIESNKDSLGNTNNENKKLISKIEFLKNQLEEKNSMIQTYKTEAMEAHEKAAMIQKTFADYPNLCNLLTNRLEELAGFLNSLLKNKNMSISSDQKREIQNAVNKTLDISRNLIADSLSVSRLSFDETNLAQLSNISGYLASSKDKIELDNSKERSLCNQSIETSLTENKNTVKRDRNSLQLLSDQHSDLISEKSRFLSLDSFNLNKLKTLSNKTNCNKNTEKEVISELPKNDSSNIKEIFENKLKCYDKIIKEKDNVILEIQYKLVESDNRLKEQNIALLEKINQLEESAKKIEKIDSELNEFRDGMNNIQSNNNKLKQELKQKNNDYEQLEKERNDLSKIIEDYKNSIEALKEETDKVNKKHMEIVDIMKENEKRKIQNITEKFKMKLKGCVDFFEGKHKEDLKWYVPRNEFMEIMQQNQKMESELGDLKSINIKLSQSEKKLRLELSENQALIYKMKKNFEENSSLVSKLINDKNQFSDEKFNLEKYIEELLYNCESLRKEKTLLIDQINKYVEKDECYESEENNEVGGTNEQERVQFKSADIGIEVNDRETNKENCEQNNEIPCINKTEDQKVEFEHGVKCIEIQKMNLKLHAKNKRLFQLYRDILKSVKKTSERFEKFESNVKQEIQKTNVVLEYARNNFNKI